ncbi:DAGAT-domain-containing protein [Xylaria palmicola]|nr:DAGAT-domain-containing protein [Xylaria palmicola]
MVDKEAAGTRRQLSGTSRGSRLPRREIKRRDNAVRKVNSDIASGKNSQSSEPAPETGNGREREAGRGKDSLASHRRHYSCASQDSYDTSFPDISLSNKKEDRQPSSPTLPSPTRRPKTVRIDTSARPPSVSQIPRGPGAGGASPRQLHRQKPSLQAPTNSKTPRRTDNALVPTSMESDKHEAELPDSQPATERGLSKEDSYVNVEEESIGFPNVPASAEDRLAPKVNGLTGNDHKELTKGNGQPRSEATYASALKSGLYSDHNRKDHDDDDSYPELDDMGMEAIHRPPPRKPNGGIRWAPWNVPFKRRGQTLVVLMHSLSILATVSLFFGFCANPFAWPLLLIYLLYVLSSKAATDGSLHYRWESLRKSYIWHFFTDYFPAKLHKTHDLPATRKYIFGYHPHGIISHGAWAAFATDALGFSQKFPGITNSLLTLDSNFRIPFYREYILSMGVRSVSKESIVNILNKGGPNGEGMGRGVTIVVGGARESLEAQPGRMRLVLRERKGFIKLAVRCGADLVPVLAFGENDLYDQLQPQEHPFMHRIQMFVLKVWKFTLPFLHGRGIFNYDVGLMPYRRPLNIVVGAPIKVRQSSSVDLDEINRLHDLYVAELEKLWDHYKDEFAPDRKGEMQILP